MQRLVRGWVGWCVVEHATESTVSPLQCCDSFAPLRCCVCMYVVLQGHAYGILQLQIVEDGGETFRCVSLVPCRVMQDVLCSPVTCTTAMAER